MTWGFSTSMTWGIHPLSNQSTLRFASLGAWKKKKQNIPHSGALNVVMNPMVDSESVKHHQVNTNPSMVIETVLEFEVPPKKNKSKMTGWKILHFQWEIHLRSLWMFQPVMLVFREGTSTAGVVLRLPSLQKTMSRGAGVHDVFCSGADSCCGYIHTPINRRLFQEVLSKKSPIKKTIRCRSCFSPRILKMHEHAILQTKQRNIWIIWCCVLGILRMLLHRPVSRKCEHAPFLKWIFKPITELLWCTKNHLKTNGTRTESNTRSIIHSNRHIYVYNNWLLILLDIYIYMICMYVCKKQQFFMTPATFRELWTDKTKG